MKIAADISLYPLNEDFIPPIDDVIERLNQHPAITVRTNPMSTQVVGEYADVMAALESEVRVTFERNDKSVFVIKLLNDPVAG